MKINDTYVDTEGRPFQNIRIKHVIVLEDPFDDISGITIPSRSPVFKKDDERLEADEDIEEPGKSKEEIEEAIAIKEATSRAEVLEMVGDIPDADVIPPRNVLFVCKLNPATRDDDLETLFSRFGKIASTEIIRDHKSGESLCYGFIEFEKEQECEEAYYKMDNVLVDDRRIHVDFSQSVAKMKSKYGIIGRVGGIGMYKWQKKCSE